MNKTIFMIISVLFALLFVGSVAGADYNVSVTSISRDDAVQRSNPLPEGDEDALDDKSELEYATFTITLKDATEAVNITGISIVNNFNYDHFDDEVSQDDVIKFDTIFPYILEPSSTRNIKVDVLVPSNLDTIDSNFNWIEHSVSAVISSNVTADKSANLKFYVENDLELDDLSVEANNDFSCDVDELWDEELDCDDEAEELIPGNDFKIILDIENIFDSDSDNDFEDVEITFDSDNRDIEPDDDDVEKDIDADETISHTMDFDVDSDVEDGDDVTIEITAYVIDHNGAAHGFKHSFELEFNVPDYEMELDIGTVLGSPACPGDYVNIGFEVTNLGSKDQDNLYVEVSQSDLGWNKISERFSLDGEDDGDYSSEDFDYRFKVPSNTDAGTYNPVIYLYYEDDGDDETWMESLSFIVDDCSSNTESSDNNGDTDDSDDDSGFVIDGNGDSTTDTGSTTTGTTGNDGSTTTGTTTSGTTVTATTKAESDDTLFVVGLAIIIVLMLAVVISLVAILLKK